MTCIGGSEGKCVTQTPCFDVPSQESRKALLDTTNFNSINFDYRLVFNGIVIKKASWYADKKAAAGCHRRREEVGEEEVKGEKHLGSISLPHAATVTSSDEWSGTHMKSDRH